MVNAHSCRSRDLVSSPCQGPYVVFLDKTVYFPSASLHPGLGCLTGR